MIEFETIATQSSLTFVKSVQTNLPLDKYCHQLNRCQKLLGVDSNQFENITTLIKNINAKLPNDKEMSNEHAKMVSALLKVQNSIERCKKTLKDYSPISVDYPFIGPNGLIKNKNYDKDEFKKLIQLAILNRIDPYLILSISLLESPRLLNKTSVSGYENGYGDLPIDGLPIFEKLGCLYKKPKNGTFLIAKPEEVESAKVNFEKLEKLQKELSSSGFENFKRFSSFVEKEKPSALNTTQEIVTLFKKLQEGCPLKGETIKVSNTLCNDKKLQKDIQNYFEYQRLSDLSSKHLNEISKSDQMKALEIGFRLDKRAAGAIVPPKEIKSIALPYGDENSTFLCSGARIYYHGSPAWLRKEVEPKKDSCCVRVFNAGENVERDFLNFMAANFIREKIIFNRSNVEEISFAIQNFNGVGCLGCTEKLKNDCLSGIHMGTRPVYGARVADLMLNSMMKNNEINLLVKEASAELGLKVPSLFCKKDGPDLITFDDKIFYNQQRDFLLGGAAGYTTIGNRKNSYIGMLNNGKMGIPGSPEDLNYFQQNEIKRNQICDKKFFSR